MSTPFCCPVCQGRGTVPIGFYDQYGAMSSSNNNPICRSCQGTGVLWEQQVTTLPFDINALLDASGR